LQRDAQGLEVDYTLSGLLLFFAFMTIYMARGAILEYKDSKKDSE
jgi:hypothetical protein